MESVYVPKRFMPGLSVPLAKELSLDAEERKLWQDDESKLLPVTAWNIYYLYYF